MLNKLINKIYSLDGDQVFEDILNVYFEN
jgi:hypothetical protein